MEGVEAVPPFGIREPSQTYADGQLREDGALLAVPIIASICNFPALLESDPSRSPEGIVNRLAGSSVHGAWVTR